MTRWLAAVVLVLLSVGPPAAGRAVASALQLDRIDDKLEVGREITRKVEGLQDGEEVFFHVFQPDGSDVIREPGDFAPRRITENHA